MNSNIPHRLHTYKKILNKDEVTKIAVKKIEKLEAKHFTEYDKLYLYTCAPTAVCFVKWILSEAIEKKLERLYFLSRDGYPFYLAAKKLCDNWNLNIECRYLHVSRYALRLPEYALLGEKCVDRICIGGIDITLRKILKRADFTDEEIMYISERCNEGYEPDRILNYPEIMRLKKKLSDIEEFHSYVRKHSCEALENTIMYLEQEGLLEPVKYALVDSGWIGTMQQSILNLLKTKRESKIEGYYFGIFELPADVDEKAYHGYYFTPAGKMKNKVYFSNCLFESIYTAPEGMTIGYRKENDCVLPVQTELRLEQHKYLIRHNELLEKYAVIYAEICKELFGKLSRNAHCGNGVLGESQIKKEKVIISKLLKYLMSRPTALELDYLGNNLFCDDVLEKDMRKIAGELTATDIKNLRIWNRFLITAGIKKGIIHESAWPEASVVRYGKNIGLNLIHITCYKYILYFRKWLKWKMKKSNIDL